MKSLWNDNEAKAFSDDALQLRVYTSRLLGEEHKLVLHGGGNTSVKINVADFFGDRHEILYVKGSGWDLSTIQAAGFAPVKLKTLKRMATLDKLSDMDMVKLQRTAMLNPFAPNPSVEAILHAIIPFKYVDHTHSDSIVTITNNKNGTNLIHEIYKDKVLIVPYVMPGFALAKKVYEITQETDWSKLEGMILMNHGVFTFSNDARISYEKMIHLVNFAENYLNKKGCFLAKSKSSEDLLTLAKIRKQISLLRKEAVIVKLDNSDKAVGFANLKNVDLIASRGPLTPDHVIRTKRIPVILKNNTEKEITDYSTEYKAYFKRNANENHTCLDSAPRWGVWQKYGALSFGKNVNEANVISDIVCHTIEAIQCAEAIGGWNALPEKEIFDVEYWELEQAKLSKTNANPEFQGKIALVTGAADGIGFACAEALNQKGAVVACLDINPDVVQIFDKNNDMKGLCCDVTDFNALKLAIEDIIRSFGGLDILISNVGIFSESKNIENMDDGLWNKNLEINLSSHQRLLKECIPYLKQGIDATAIFIGSKNVPAPGPGASAYSVSKAGLTQLARVAAMELAEYGIRVNVVHPNAVFDTGIWTRQVLEERAKHYGITVEQYKTNNLLKTNITSKNVAVMVCSMVGQAFAKTTGAQVPVDGGNNRVI